MTIRPQRTVDLREYAQPVASDKEREENEERIARISSFVRSMYVSCAREYLRSPNYGEREIPQWDGGADPYGVRHTAVWPKIARFVLQHNVPLMPFIRAQFQAVKLGRRIPTPNQFYNQQALENYYRYMASVEPNELARRARLEKDAILSVAGPYVEELGWPIQRAVEYAMGDLAGLGISPLTRFCVAVQTELPDLAERYRDPALMQYLWESAQYDEVWGDKIPAEFRQEADSLRKALESI